MRVDAGTAQPVAGGCIHGAWRLDGPDGPIFLKTSAPSADWLLAAEVDGLAALQGAGYLRVPAVLGRGTDSGKAWLALEWLELRPATPASDHALGERLARQHLVAGPCFGWHRDNAIGATPQRNGFSDDWAAFFAAQRIGYQFELGARQGWSRLLLQQGRRLCERVPELLGDRRISPALLHGDLWSGNRAADAAGQPLAFDPAVHYGDPECDLAMTRLFGGFQPSFYAAYDALIPPAPGRAMRCRLYQLYHVLNHANLFGGGYVAQAEELVDQLIKG